jgi:protein ImuA
MSTPSPLPETCGALSRRFDAAAFALSTGLEEVCVSGSAGMAAGLGFLAARAALGPRPETRLAAVAAPRFWFSERGRPYAHGLTALGLTAGRLLVIAPRTEAETLWALEETLRSGAAALVVGAVEGASLVATRRLDLIAREAGALAALIRTTPTKNLSAARRRWRLSQAPSAPHPHDPKASGAPRWRAVLERSRDGALGEALLEHDDETFRLHLVDGLADHGLARGASVAA